MGTERDLAEELAVSFREKDVWNMAECEKLCWLAGMEDEWKRADGENFEAVLYKAANKLGVEIQEVRYGR